MNNYTGEPALVAIHEAGNVVMAWLMEIPITSAEVGVMGGSANWLQPIHWSDFETWEVAERFVRVALGGGCAESIFCGCTNYSATNDLYIALRITQIFGKSAYIPNIFNEVHSTVFANQEAICRIARALEQKKKLFAHDLTVMQKEFACHGEKLCLVA